MEDWKQLLADLRLRGWTQQQIAEEVGSSQSAISELNSGETKNPTYSVGRRIVDLHASGRIPANAAA